MNRSEISDQFNFVNDLDITQNRRDKTDQYFSKSGFAFEDFMNIGDRTSKSIDKMSSKHPNNTSEIFKKEQDSSINPNNIMDYLTEHSIKRKKQLSVLDSLSQNNPPEMLNNGISPKFGVQFMPTTKSIPEMHKKELRIKRTDSIPVDKTPANQILDPTQRSTKTLQNAFKRKDTVGGQKQQEYKQLQNQIKFYEGSLERMIYESHRMQEESENLMSSFNSAAHETEIQVYAKEIKTINAQIQEQRNFQAQLTRMVSQLQDDYEQLLTSIKTSNFARPVKMKDEAKALVDEINTLKAEFQALQRDDGSLNLSSTLLNNPSAFHPGNTFRRPSKKDSAMVLNKIQQIYAENKRSQDPRFLHNIKMICLRDEWNLYANSDIQINVNYRHCPVIRVTLGNKLTKDLQKFTMTVDGVANLQGETISAKSYIIHQMEVKEDTIDELFIKCQLSYMRDGAKRNVCLFVPTGVTTFGEFSPVTEKQFAMDAGKEQFEFCTGFRPLDKKLVANITEVEYYMPNILIDRQNFKCCGMFISLFNTFTFLQFRQRGELVSVSSKTPNWPLIRLLEFIFTLIGAAMLDNSKLQGAKNREDSNPSQNSSGYRQSQGYITLSPGRRNREKSRVEKNNDKFQIEHEKSVSEQLGIYPHGDSIQKENENGDNLPIRTEQFFKKIPKFSIQEVTIREAFAQGSADNLSNKKKKLSVTKLFNNIDLSNKSQNGSSYKLREYDAEK